MHKEPAKFHHCNYLSDRLAIVKSLKSYCQGIAMWHLSAGNKRSVEYFRTCSIDDNKEKLSYSTRSKLSRLNNVR